MDWSDYESVMAAVQQDGWALEYADATLRANEKIVMAAVQQDGRALEFADDTLKANEEFIAYCLSVNRGEEATCKAIWEFTDEKKQSQKFQHRTSEFLESIAKHESLFYFTPWVRQLILELIKFDFPEPETCYVIDDELEMRWKTHGILLLVEIDTLRFVITPELVTLPSDIKVFHFELPEEKEKASSIFLEESIRNIQKHWR
jgi:hypothetical protein